MLRTSLRTAAVAMTLLGGAPALADQTPLIPRQVLFGNPDKAQVRVSPDGQYISYLAPVNGVLNVWVAPIGQLDQAKPVTSDRSRGIIQHRWSYSPGVLLYLQDQGGDENYQVFSVDVASGHVRNLIDNPNVRTQILETSPKLPDELLVGINDRNPAYHDVWRVNLKTGDKSLQMQNPEQINGEKVAGFVTDDQFNIRFVATATDTGGNGIYLPAGDGKFELYDQIDMEDSVNTDIIGFDATGQVAYVTDSRGRNTAALYAMNVKTKEKKLLAEHPAADAPASAMGLLIHPTTYAVQAVAFNYKRAEWKVLDPAVQPDIDYLRTVADGDFQITARTLDDTKWSVAYIMDNGPARYYLYDRTKKQADYLFSNRRELENLPLARMHPVVVKSRDGLDLVCYLTLPRDADSDQDGRPERPVPMVLDVHGGPWARDTWGFNPEAQFLANRGYAVLEVNYRGSTGFGKNFVNAGNRQWAGKMHDDLIDAVNWAIENRIAPKDKVAIMGGSYGGYATLVGLTFTPDVFACGVDIVGPSNINTLLSRIPPYWAAGLATWRARVGDNSTEEGRQFLESRSPLNFVDRIKRPLLIGHGANDPRVKQAEADQIVKAMTERNIPVTYVLYPDEGHGFQRPENRMSFYAITEAFLAHNLGGRAEPIGDAFTGSSIKVPVDTGNIPGLKDALSAIK